MKRTYVIVTVIKAAAIGFVTSLIRVVMGRPEGYVEEALAKAARDIALHFLNLMEERTRYA